jgi:hypothetical protein
VQEQLGDQDLDPGAIFSRSLRLLRLDTSALEEVRDNRAQTVPAVAVVGVAVLLSALGGWLWLAFEFDGLSAGRIFLREFLLGTVFGVLLWAVWVLIVELVLTQAYSQHVDRGALVRCMGFAAAPGVLMLLVLVPSLSLGIGIVALGGWWLLSDHAIRTAVPGVPPPQAAAANLAGFAVFALVLSLLGHQAGMAPGVFVHAGGVSEYIGSDFSVRFSQALIEGARAFLA